MVADVQPFPRPRIVRQFFDLFDSITVEQIK